MQNFYTRFVIASTVLTLASILILILFGDYLPAVEILLETTNAVVKPHYYLAHYAMLVALALLYFHNIVLFIASRDRLFLLYAIYLAFVLLQVILYSNLPYEREYFMPKWAEYLAAGAFGSLSAVYLWLFAAQFLVTRLPEDRWFVVAMQAAVVISLMNLFLAFTLIAIGYTNLSFYNSIDALVSLLGIGAIIWQSVITTKRGSLATGIFGASAMMILIAYVVSWYVQELALTQGWAEGLETSAMIWMVGLVLEAMVMAIAIGVRLRERSPIEPMVAQDQDVTPGISSEILTQRINPALASNLSDPSFDVQALSRIVAMSPSTLRRAVKAATGSSPSVYLRGARLALARDILETGKAKTIADAGYQAGFSNPSHFTRVFREHYGLAPSELLRQKKTGV